MRSRLPVLTLVAALLTPVSGGARAAEGPPLEVPEAALRAALECPGSFTDADREPVLLVHGTFTEPETNWSWGYVPGLAALGFDVCTVRLPNRSLGDMQEQAEYVVFAIREISRRTGGKVDVIGASQGSLHPRWAVKWWPDVRAAVDDLVMLAGPNHGTEATRLGTVTGNCFPSCWQMATGSNYITALNAGDETPGDVSYTSIYTLFDELVIPQLPESTSALDGGSNIAVQDVCPGRPVEHAGLSTADAVGFALAIDALTNDGPADPARFDVATCAQALLPGAEPFTLLGQSWEPGDWSSVEEEPPLKPYAQGQAASGEDAGNGEATGSPAGADGTEPGPRVLAAAEVAVSDDPVGGALPAAGANLLLLLGSALALVAAGGNLLQVRASRVAAVRASRSAERRTLPASSRRGSDTNS